MLALTPQHPLLLAFKPVDFRRGIDGLAAICHQQFKEQSDSGTAFVFTNKRKVSVKILVYDGQGYWLCIKRFSEGKLKWWPTCDAGIKLTYILNNKVMQSIKIASIGLNFNFSLS